MNSSSGRCRRTRDRVAAASSGWPARPADAVRAAARGTSGPTRTNSGENSQAEHEQAAVAPMPELQVGEPDALPVGDRVGEVLPRLAEGHLTPGSPPALDLPSTAAGASAGTCAATRLVDAALAALSSASSRADSFRAASRPYWAAVNVVSASRSASSVVRRESATESRAICRVRSLSGRRRRHDALGAAARTACEQASFADHHIGVAVRWLIARPSAPAAAMRVAARARSSSSSVQPADARSRRTAASSRVATPTQRAGRELRAGRPASTCARRAPLARARAGSSVRRTRSGRCR